MTPDKRSYDARQWTIRNADDGPLIAHQADSGPPLNPGEVIRAVEVGEQGGPFHVIHADAQDNQVAVGCYDVGIGPAVVFDGGSFIDGQALRALATDLIQAADWLDSMRRQDA